MDVKHYAKTVMYSAATLYRRAISDLERSSIALHEGGCIPHYGTGRIIELMDI